MTRSHSRPHCSNDNPFSEAQFKTLKYRPDFPDRFGCIEDARVFCDRFFRWYALDHRHSGSGLHTPADVHHGRAQAVRQARGRVLDAPTPRTLSGSFATRPSLRRCPASCGSTSPRTKRRRLSNYFKSVSQKG